MTDIHTPLPVTDTVWNWKQPSPAPDKPQKLRPCLQGLVGLFFASLLYYLGHITIATIAATAALIVVLAAFFLPALHRKIEKGFTLLGHAVAVLLTWIFLVPFFYLILWPLSFFIRSSYASNFSRKAPTDCASYWIKRQTPSQPEHYKRQF